MSRMRIRCTCGWVHKADLLVVDRVDIEQTVATHIEKAHRNVEDWFVDCTLRPAETIEVAKAAEGPRS